MLACQRPLFSLPPGLHYLNGAYMSPQLRAAEAAGRAGLAVKNDPTRIRPEDFFEPANAVRERFGRLVGARPERVAIVAAASYGLGVVARNVALAPGQTIVVVGEQFPSNVYPWRRLAAESGASVRTVAGPDAERRAEAWTAALLDAIDATTGVVAVPHVHWADGTLFDLAAIGARARSVGAVFVVDGTQSVGALPFDVAALRPDALVCGAYKWLLGPYGSGLAVFGERFDDGAPLEENWIGRAGAEDFGGLVHYTDAYGPGAVRYDVGERSDPVRLPMLRAGLDQLLEWTPAAVQAYAIRIADAIAQGAAGLGWHAAPPDQRAGHLFGLRPPPGTDLDAVRDALAGRRVSVSVRGDALRVSPSVYNTDADADALLAALAAVG